MYLLMTLPPSLENVSQNLSLQKGVNLSGIDAKLITEGQRYIARRVALVNSTLIAQARTNDGVLFIKMKNKKIFKGNRKTKRPNNDVCYNRE